MPLARGQLSMLIALRAKNAKTEEAEAEERR
jgi:hypothetical protein